MIARRAQREIEPMMAMGIAMSSGQGVAMIVGGKNVKLDFTPAYQAPVVADPGPVVAGLPMTLADLRSISTAGLAQITPTGSVLVTLPLTFPIGESVRRFELAHGRPVGWTWTESED
jgi:hypothetical protein